FAARPANAVPPAISAAAPASATTPATNHNPRFLIRPSLSTPALPKPLPRPPVPARDAVERDPERQDRDRRHDAVAELVPLEALRNLVAERARADEAADHDDRQHHDDPLVDAEHDRVAGERDLHLLQHLPARRAERA